MAETVRSCANSLLWKSRSRGPGFEIVCDGRTITRLMLALTALFLFLAVPVVQAQTNYSIDWFTIDGGGGTSTGGIYSVSGTIGQPDAGVTMTGGNYSVAGGFWSLFAVQTPGAPTLQIFLTTTNTAVVEWPGSDLDWKLRWTPSLSGAPVVWTEQAYSTNSTSSWFIQSTPTGNRFYQLHKP